MCAACPAPVERFPRADAVLWVSDVRRLRHREVGHAAASSGSQTGLGSCPQVLGLEPEAGPLGAGAWLASPPTGARGNSL